MLGPNWKAGCPSCSYLADNFQGISPHLKARDISFAAISRAPLDEIERYKKRMGWTFDWHSSFDSDFNFDMNVSFTEKELEEESGIYNYSKLKFPSSEAPGASVFYKNESDEVFHTYSTFGRGLDMLLGSYHYIDMTPIGRNEQELPFSMAWVKRHDEYES